MSSRTPIIALAATLVLTTACTNKKVSNPLAKVDSKQPDVVLFNRGMDAMKHNHFDIARLDMQTLINTYPDSEYIARAKLALADSWYAEGGSAAWAQAEQEYTDFITFFPNMPEAAEAQVKIANIHFSQMEKPDRDFTHAVRAEQEYRKVILQYPDNPKMVQEARVRLLQVQEVIAEREFRVGRFYYLRQSFPAAIARLKTLIDRYPLYSKADETLYLLGQSYEGEIANLKHMDEAERKLREQGKVTEAQLKNDEAARERLVSGFTAEAAAAYQQILTRYPVMNRSDDAKARLLALHQPVPRPTKAMLAQNKAEEASRHDKTLLSDFTGILSRRPNTSEATSVGAPPLQDSEPVSPTTIVQEAAGTAGGNKQVEKLAGEVTGGGPPTENQPAPRSDDPNTQASGQNANAQANGQSGQTSDPNELKPASGTSADSSSQTDANDATPDPNELKPNVAPDTPAPAPAQVNELNQGTQGGDGNSSAQAAAGSDASSGQELADDQTIASSKHKKKKGLGKLIPGK